MNSLKNLVGRFVREEEGANMVEYALLVALIGVMLIAAIGFLTGSIQGVFGRASNSLNTAGVTAP